MDDLISRKMAIEEFEDMVTSVSVYGESAEARYANNARLRFIEKLADIPSVPAVPLDKLCEWLAEHYGSPCQLAEIDCYPQCEPDENGECYGMRTDDKRCWHDYLTKWMEGLNAEVH